MAGKDFATTVRKLVDKAEADLAASPFAASLRSLAGTGDRFREGRPLTDAERSGLEARGNVCGDWSRVRISGGDGLEAVRGNVFEGDVLLAGFRGECRAPGGRARSAGMYGCRVRDAVIGNASLFQVVRLERQVIEDGAVLEGAGELDCPAPTSFGLGSAIHPGSEAGTRSVWLWDGLTLEECALAASLPRDAQAEFAAELARMLAPYVSGFGFVGRGAAVLHARRVVAAWIGPGSVVAGAALLRESALLSPAGAPAGSAALGATVAAGSAGAGIAAGTGGSAGVAGAAPACFVGDGAWVEQALLQAGARVDNGGKVSRSLLLRDAEVSFGGMVSQSVIGPHTQVAKGEVTASLVGPFVGLHHQSLLISALWPEGVGNVAYGANVGSNHTGKKPDQEIRPGEGTFFGLGCVIKFPANFADAPYSIFAAGLTTLPQRLRFPFSLVNQPTAAIPELGPAINEILPGWMWSDNAYALVRRCYKVLDGDPSRASDADAFPGTALAPGFFTGPLFAPAMIRRALRALESLRAAPDGKPFYLEEDIAGLGKNFLLGKKRASAIAAYADFLTFFLFRACADRPAAWSREAAELVAAASAAVGAVGPDGETPGTSTAGASSAETADAASRIAGAADPHASVRTFLAGRVDRLRGFQGSLRESLGRDDRRGRQIFDDYADFHDAPAADSAIRRLGKDVDALLARLGPMLAGPAPSSS